VTELSKSEKEIYDLRREKVEKLKETGSFPTYFKNTSFITDIHANHQSLDNGEQTKVSVTVRGRVISIRSFGKLTFIDLKDSTGKIQLLASKDDSDKKLEENIELMDVGDIVGTSGIIMKTKKESFR
jgi:lysyl-tRNA synthetase class 2